MKKLLVLLFVATAVVGGWYAISPKRAMDELRSAARAGDAEALREVVDFEAVRANLETDLRAGVDGVIPQDDDNPFAAAGRAIGAAIVDGTVDAIVRPEAIASLARGRDPRKADGAEASDGSEDPEEQIDRQGPNQFVVRFRDESDDAADDERSPELVFRRYGLRWRLVRVLLSAS